MKIKIDVGGKIIERVPKAVPFGNFQQVVIRYNNEYYLVGDGDEYLRGIEDRVFKLGMKLNK